MRWPGWGLAAALLTGVDALRLCIGASLVAAAAVDAQEANPVAPRTVAARTRITGTVFDSVANLPLPNATVQLIAQDNPAVIRSARTDSAGRFAFDTVVAGRYAIGFEHPRLDSLLLRSPVQSVLVGGDHEVTGVALTIPSRQALVELFCGARPDTTAPALMLGRLRTTDGMPWDGRASMVRARWRQLRFDGDRLRAQTDSSVARLQSSAAFVLCGLPLDATIAVQALVATDSSGTVEFEMPPSGVLTRDLMVAVGVEQEHAVNERSARSSDSGEHSRRGRFIGQVRDSAGHPIARAQIQSVNGEAQALTDSAGRFLLDVAIGGTQAIDVRAIGFVPRRLVIDIPREPVATELFVLQRSPSTLAAVHVRAPRSFAGFEARRARGIGLFLDEETIRKRNPWTVADALRQQPGVRVLPETFLGAKFLTRFGRAACEPTVYVDGVELLGRTKALDGFVDVNRVRAIEVYAVPAEVPREFPADALCGAVLIWTRK